MFPGFTTKLSEKGPVTSTTTIHVTTDLITLTGQTAIATLVPHFGGGFSGIVVIVPTGGAVATTTAGNISLAVTMADMRSTVLVYSKRTGTWYPGAIS